MDILDKHYGSHETTEAVYVRHKEIRDEMVKTELELKAGAAECLDELLAAGYHVALRRRRASLRPSATLRWSVFLTSLRR